MHYLELTCIEFLTKEALCVGAVCGADVGLDQVFAKGSIVNTGCLERTAAVLLAKVVIEQFSWMACGITNQS
jgi:hypothetical protein